MRPTSLCRSTLRPVMYAWIFRRIPRPSGPPLPPLAWYQVTISHWGFSCRGSICIPCSYASPSCVLLQLLTYCGYFFLSVDCFCARARDRGTSIPLKLLVPVLSPLILGHSGSIQATLPPPSPLSVPPFSSWSHPRQLKAVRRKARCAHILLSL